MIAMANASFSAMRRIRRARNRKTAPIMKRTTIIPAAVNISRVSHCSLLTAHCSLLIAHCSLFLIAGAHRRLDVSAHVEIAFDLHAEWIARVYKVIEDDVDDVLVENFYFAK